MCNPVEYIKDLIGNPLFKDYMVYTHACTYMDSAGLHQVIDNMWTAYWWYKTCLLQFQGNKSAYPVYLSIDNIAKEKQQQMSARATVLISYLPAGKLDCFTHDERSLTGYQLFHHCMSLLLQPLIAGEDGVKMMCTDLSIHQVYLILAAYVENHCPKCVVAADERGDLLTLPMQNPALMKELLEKRKTGHHPAKFDDYILWTVYTPFWANLPHSDIFLAFTPNLLHQLHKGIFKDHLVKWCLDIVGEEEMNARFKMMPDYPSLWHFKKGILSVKQWTGTEHKEMQQVFLALLASSVPSQVLVVVQAILDFSYYAHLQVHIAESLNGLESALAIFHANKDVLQELDVHEHFNIPKLHQLSHYVQSILLFGATDGFNSKLPEQLHINFAKEVYCASNKHDYKEQMALWLQHQKASQLALTNSTSHEHGYDSNLDSEMEGPGTVLVNALPILPKQQVVHILAKTPAYSQQSIQHLITAHGATMFLPALKLFLIVNPGLQDHFDVFQQVVILGLIHLATPEVPPGCGQKPGTPARCPHQFGTYSRALAYIEWFTLLREPDPSSGLHQVSCLTRQLHWNAAVIHVDKITHPCHVIPKMGQSIDHGWTSTNVYELASDFHLNTYIDLDTFSMSIID
ncbi:hypothetical protein F4604DRAFT_1877992 [Suillus subluteus]|nr:hypothetical protein F4604DRAFT_1877992 [Suillus subluteus]